MPVLCLLASSNDITCFWHTRHRIVGPRWYASKIKVVLAKVFWYTKTSFDRTNLSLKAHQYQLMWHSGPIRPFAHFGVGENEKQWRNPRLNSSFANTMYLMTIQQFYTHGQANNLMCMASFCTRKIYWTRQHQGNRILGVWRQLRSEMTPILS